MKNQNGITLIALVITIIVLVILSSITIKATVGENGVLTKAESTVDKNKKIVVLEDAERIIISWHTDYILDGLPYYGRYDKTENGADVVCTGEKVLVIDNENGNTYSASITEEGKIGTFEEIENDTTSQVYKAMHPKIPTGYEYVTGEWNTGYVIKETSTEDQFVWIPVLTENAYAKKSGSVNNYYITSSSKFDPKYVDLVASGDITGDDYGTNAWVTSAETEKDTVYNVGGFYVSRYEVGIESQERAAILTKTDINNAMSITAKSQYGMEPLRYITQEAATIIANNWKRGEDVQSGLITGTQWDTMCKFIDWSTCDSDCTNWGNYYDIKSKVYTESIWYAGSGTAEKFYWYNTPITKTSEDDNARMIFGTGCFINENMGTTAKKNIYDVAGNVWEWTTETIKRNPNQRVSRGASVNNESVNYGATSRQGYYSKTGSSWVIGFRAVLYVK